VVQLRCIRYCQAVPEKDSILHPTLRNLHILVRRTAIIPVVRLN